MSAQLWASAPVSLWEQPPLWDQPHPSRSVSWRVSSLGLYRLGAVYVSVPPAFRRSWPARWSSYQPDRWMLRLTLQPPWWFPSQNRLTVCEVFAAAEVGVGVVVVGEARAASALLRPHPWFRPHPRAARPLLLHPASSAGGASRRDDRAAVSSARPVAVCLPYSLRRHRRRLSLPACSAMRRHPAARPASRAPRLVLFRFPLSRPFSALG